MSDFSFLMHLHKKLLKSWMNHYLGGKTRINILFIQAKDNIFLGASGADHGVYLWPQSNPGHRTTPQVKEL